MRMPMTMVHAWREGGEHATKGKGGGKTTPQRERESSLVRVFEKRSMLLCLRRSDERLTRHRFLLLLLVGILNLRSIEHLEQADDSRAHA